MKKLLIILFLIGFSTIVFADQPPCWCEFSIKSSNSLFRADITFRKSDSLLKPWERKWTIKVYENKQKPKLLWSSKFYQDGYGGGILSNDGQAYIYINDWLDMSEPPNQAVIYTQKKTSRFSGKDLLLNPNNYQQTISHQIWKKEYKLIPNHLSDSTFLKIETVDFKEIIINITTGKIKNSRISPQFTEEINMAKKYGIISLIFIGLGIILIGLKNRNRKMLL